MKNLIKTFEAFDADDFREMEIAHHDKMNQEPENYMFFGDLETIVRCAQALLKMDPMKVDELLKNGHNWALDHIATSKDDVEEVYNFLTNEMSGGVEESHAKDGKMYQCDECSMVYEEHECNEDMTCECGGTINLMEKGW